MGCEDRIVTHPKSKCKFSKNATSIVPYTPSEERSSPRLILKRGAHKRALTSGSETIREERMGKSKTVE